MNEKEEVLNVINDVKGIDKIELLIKYDNMEEEENEINNLLKMMKIIWMLCFIKDIFYAIKMKLIQQKKYLIKF